MIGAMDGFRSIEQPEVYAAEKCPRFRWGTEDVSFGPLEEVYTVQTVRGARGRTWRRKCSPLSKRGHGCTFRSALGIDGLVLPRKSALLYPRFEVIANG